MSEPVACGYCGCDTWIPDTVHGDAEIYQIRCEDCGVCGPAGTTEDESWELWNDLMDRIGGDSDGLLVESLRDDLREAKKSIKDLLMRNKKLRGLLTRRMWHGADGQ